MTQPPKDQQILGILFNRPIEGKRMLDLWHNKDLKIEPAIFLQILVYTGCGPTFS